MGPDASSASRDRSGQRVGLDGLESVDWGSTREDWIRGYITSASTGLKVHPPAPPGSFSPGQAASPVRLGAPGRDPGLRVSPRADRIPRPGALVEASAVARLLHVFIHHEVQAAELCGWAILAFPQTPLEFREGLFSVMLDEVRHAAVYAERVRALGSCYGDHPVRDWFWERTLACETPLQYVALMGLGFEGGNLEHARRFDQLLQEAGDPESAALVARVGREEVAHVHFAARWFSEWSDAAPEDGPDFDRWAAELPPPLTPAVLRGRPLDRVRRGKAGLSEAFLDRLEAFGTTSEPSDR